MKEEAETTRKMLSAVPTDKLDWRPHPKSMTIMQLTTHITELPGWVAMALKTEELDFAGMPYTPTTIADSKELLPLLGKNLAAGLEALAHAKEEDLLPNWTLRTGEHIHSIRTKGEVIRMAFSQTVHHRAQLGVFLRLLDVPIPGSYGPSADDTKF